MKLIKTCSIEEKRMATVEEEITKYESFVNERLRNDLRLIENQQQNIFIQLNNYTEIKAFINEMKRKSFGETSLKTKVDLGSNFYVRCTIPADEKIILFVGLGFYVEFTLDEALPFIDKRCELLKSSLGRLSQQACKIKAHIKLILDTLGRLQGISQDIQEEA